MTLISEQHRIAYFSIPKVASTSQKRALHEAFTGTPWTGKNSRGNYLHQEYPSRAFERRYVRELKGYFTYAVVRDPIERIVSAYAYIVQTESDGRNLEPKKRQRKRLIERAGLDPKPDLETFCLRIKDYCSVEHGGVRHHTRPMRHFLGNRIDWFSRVYPIEQLGEAEQEISRRLGKPVVFQKLNPSKPRKSAPELSDRALEALLNYTSKDYDLLERFYPRPVTRSARKSGIWRLAALGR